jgi:hypothetical protein
MLTMTNQLTIEGFTVYQDDTDLVEKLLDSVEDRPRPVAEVDADGNPVVVMRPRRRGTGGEERRRRFYVLPKAPTIAKDEQGNPIFSLIVYRRDEERIELGDTGEDVGGGILTFTAELTIPEETFKSIRQKLRSHVFGADASDPTLDVDLAVVPFLEGTVTVAVAGEMGGEEDAEFVKNTVGTGKIGGVGGNRRAVMVRLSQAGAALMSQLEQLRTLPINLAYALSFEHRLLGVTMQVWCDMTSSFHLVQEVFNVKTDEEDDGYLGWGSRDVYENKIKSVAETMVRSKTAGVTVIPQSSQVDAETLASLEKFGLDMLNKEMEKAVVASPPPPEIDRRYIEKFFQDYANAFTFSLDRRMVLVQSFTPSANIDNVFQEGDFDELVAFVDLRTAFFTILKVPIRVNADFTKLPLDSVTVTVSYERQRFDGTGMEHRVDSFDFTDGSAIQTFVAFANSLADVRYDWWATVHYKGSPETYEIRRNNVTDDFLVVDVGSLGMLQVDLGLGLVDLEQFPGAKVSVQYHSEALGQTLEQEFVLNDENESALWTEVIHEQPTAGYKVKVDWLKADGDILPGQWEDSTASRHRFDAPIPDRIEVAVVCTGDFEEGGEDQIAQVGVTFAYRDPDNDYEVGGQLVFSDAKQQQTWTADIRNPELREYEYRYTIVRSGGVVDEFPEDGGWYKGEPGFITVGEKYSMEVDIYPTLQSYPDHAKVVQVDLTYDENGVHRSDSFVFSKESNQPRAWRVRGAPGGSKRYRVKISYFSINGEVTTRPEVVQESEALVVPPAPAPATPSAPVG